MPRPDSPSDPSAPVSRRDFLGRFAAFGAVGLGMASTLAACGGGENGGAGDGSAADSASCEGFATLTPQQRQLRQSLNYVDDSPNPAQNCANCRFWLAPAAGAACGGCQILPEQPVVASGYCTSWVAQAA